MCVCVLSADSSPPWLALGFFPTANWVDIKRFSRLKFNCDIDKFIIIIYTYNIYYIVFYVIVSMYLFFIVV